LSYNKLDKVQIAAIEMILNSGGTKVSAAEIVLGRKSQESSIRNAIKRGDINPDKMRGADQVIEKEVKRSTTVPETFKVPYQARAFNNKKDVYKIETVKSVPENVTQLMIPDTQCQPNIPMGYLSWLGQYIVDKQPEVIVHIGDHCDFPSLSSYDKGKGSAEGKRVQKDIEASIEGMNLLLKPLYDLQQEQLEEYGEILYKPKMVITLGNHEYRLMRHIDANPELIGFLSYDNLRYEDMGWEQYDFLKPVIINGVTYCHFMANPMTGKPYGGAALNVLKNVGESFCQGHKQCLDVATRFLPSSGKQQWAIIAGAYYEHDEAYKSFQGNHHWRGVVVKHQVKDGSFNPQFVDLAYLKSKYN
tara:strand:- start:745 stop:1824 length:1080 start_codon:yes stop_codon:yes gene_type:complete